MMCRTYLGIRVLKLTVLTLNSAPLEIKLSDSINLVNAVGIIIYLIILGYLHFLYEQKNIY